NHPQSVDMSSDSDDDSDSSPDRWTQVTTKRRRSPSSSPRKTPTSGNQYGKRNKRSSIKNLALKVSAVDKSIKLANSNPIKMAKLIQLSVGAVRAVKRC
ncbi:hypothetical protein ScPMuIL_005114, partial [Solemya velum]